MQEKQKSWFRRHWILTSILGLLIVIIILGAFSSDSPKNITGDVIKEETAEEDLLGSYEEAAQKAVDVSYESLMRYSESYEGKWICFEGQIMQVVSDVPELELIVSTKKDEWVGYMDDMVYLRSDDYSSERLLEKDIIQFCGKSTGMITYEAIFGNKISIPEIETDDLYVKRVN
jgi:hypothetical protein